MKWQDADVILCQKCMSCSVAPEAGLLEWAQLFRHREVVQILEAAAAAWHHRNAGGCGMFARLICCHIMNNLGMQILWCLRLQEKIGAPRGALWAR